MGEELEKSAPGAESAPPLLLSFGAPKRRPGHPISWKEGGEQRGIPSSADLPTRACSFELGRSSLTSRSLWTFIAPYAGYGTKTRANGNLGPQGGWRTGALTRAGRPRSGPGRLSPGQGTVPYLRGSCREGRRGSATIPGLNVLPLSPYPSIQLGLLPLASPWKKFRRKGGGKKSITLRRRGSLPRPAGAASREARSTSAKGAQCRRPPPLSSPAPGPALAIHHSLPRQCRSGPAPRPPELGFHPDGREGVRRGGPGCRAGGQGDLGNQGPASAGRVPGSDLTATPHSPGWLRRPGHQDLREL